MRLRDITEGRDAPLYHGTKMVNLLSILYHDSLDKGAYWNRPGEPDGPRLSRAFVTAWSFSEDDGEGRDGAVLELNQTLLAQRYRIVPYADVDGQGENWSNESEEVVVTKAIAPLSKYLTGIYIPHAAIQAILTDPEQMEWWAEVELAAMYPTADHIEQALLNLSRHLPRS